MKRKKTARPPQVQSDAKQGFGESLFAPSRRSFLRTAAGAGAALSSSPLSALADHHGHPSPNSISYLDRRMYIRNMEVLAHFGTGETRHGKMQMMSVGNRRYMFQQGDVIDVSDVRKRTMFNKGGFDGYQVQVAYNKNLKKWILMTGAQTPITDSTPEAPMGKYDDPHLDDKRKNYKGLRGVRFYDASDPAKMVKISEFSTGATGQGTHRNYYDGGKYAYLDTAPDETGLLAPEACERMNEQSGFEPPPQYSGMGIAFHTIYCGILERGFVISNGETTNSDCNQIYLPNWVIDIRDEQHPVPV